MSRDTTFHIVAYCWYFGLWWRFFLSFVLQRIPLVITRLTKLHWFWPDFRANYSPLYDDFFNDLGIDWLLFFQKNSEKTKFGIFETPKWHIFDHIGSAQRRFLLYFPYYLPIRKYAWKMLQNRFFCNFSKTSEKTAYLHKKVCQNPQRSSRCRYERVKKVKST